MIQEQIEYPGLMARVRGIRNSHLSEDIVIVDEFFFTREFLSTEKDFLEQLERICDEP